VGTTLLRLLVELDPTWGDLEKLQAAGEKKPVEALKLVRAWLLSSPHDLDVSRADWSELRDLLVAKRDFLLRLLENGNLLEHESFTDMLWAVFHLTEELAARNSLQDLPESDYRHLRGDITRVYGALARRWLAYMRHLEKKYPYLFSLAMRTNPFNPAASPVVKE